MIRRDGTGSTPVRVSECFSLLLSRTIYSGLTTEGRVTARPFVLGGIMADILWICNRQRCEDCFEECRHTSDREFAVNPEFDRNRFEEDQDGNLWEDGVGRG